MWSRSTKFGLHVFFETLTYNNIENRWYKVRQLLKNETENSYYKVITKCDRNLLQSLSGITKCGRLLLQSSSGITKCDRPLLQSASGITKFGRLFLQSVRVITKWDVTRELIASFAMISGKYGLPNFERKHLCYLIFIAFSLTNSCYSRFRWQLS